MLDGAQRMWALRGHDMTSTNVSTKNKGGGKYYAESVTGVTISPEIRVHFSHSINHDGMVNTGGWHSYNKRPVRVWNIKNTYGLSKAEAEVLYTLSASGPCEICGRIGRLVVDHDHTNGRIRGLLCRLCNGYMGAIDENVRILRRALEYLERE